MFSCGYELQTIATCNRRMKHEKNMKFVAFSLAVSTRCLVHKRTSRSAAVGVVAYVTEASRCECPCGHMHVCCRAFSLSYLKFIRSTRVRFRPLVGRSNHCLTCVMPPTTGDIFRSAYGDSTCSCVAWEPCKCRRHALTETLGLSNANQKQ